MVVIIYPNQSDAALDSLSSGTYFVSFLGEATKLSDKIFWPYDRQSLESLFFFSEMGKLYAMSPDGTILKPITDVTKSTDLKISPNKNWFVINKNNSQIELYSKDLQLIKSWSVEAHETIWRPDSAGFFLGSYPNVYYLDLNSQELNLVTICSIEKCYPRDFIWLP